MSASRRRRRPRLGLTVSTAQTAAPRCQANVTGTNRSSTSAGGPSGPARPPVTDPTLPEAQPSAGRWRSGQPAWTARGAGGRVGERWAGRSPLRSRGGAGGGEAGGVERRGVGGRAAAGEVVGEHAAGRGRQHHADRTVAGRDPEAGKSRYRSDQRVAVRGDG